MTHTTRTRRVTLLLGLAIVAAYLAVGIYQASSVHASDRTVPSITPVSSTYTRGTTCHHRHHHHHGHGRGHHHHCGAAR